MKDASRIREALRWAVYAITVIVMLGLPLVLDDPFMLNRIAQFLVYGLLAISISVVWGYGGMLVLGQALFFGIGSYMLAMSLTLAGAGPSGVPQFMILQADTGAPRELASIHPGSWLWLPFQSQTFGLFMGVALPILFATLLGAIMFWRRVSGVFVAIITLALMIIVQMVIINNQPLINGFNGLASMDLLQFGDWVVDGYSVGAYMLIAVIVSLTLILGRLLMLSRAGLILKAIRDDEERVRYLGYNVALYKTWFFGLGAAIAGLAGMLYVVVSEIASPSQMAAVFSVTIVVWAAVGGRATLVGAFLGALLVNIVETGAAESDMFRPLWPLILGGLFILVVLLFPRGAGGTIDMYVDRYLRRKRTSGSDSKDSETSTGSRAE